MSALRSLYTTPAEGFCGEIIVYVADQKLTLHVGGGCFLRLRASTSDVEDVEMVVSVDYRGAFRHVVS